MIEKQELEAALPALARTGLPLLVHAELAEHLYQGGRHGRLAAIRDLPALASRRVGVSSHPHADRTLPQIPVSTAHCSSVHRPGARGSRPSSRRGPSRYGRDLSSLPALRRRRDSPRRHALQMRSAYPLTSQSRSAMARAARWDHRSHRDRSFSLPAIDEASKKEISAGHGEGLPASVAMSVIWTEMRKRGLPLQDLARWMSAQPAKLAGIEERKGAIAAGRDADLVVFDPDAEFVLSTGDLHYRHPVSPYLGERLRGKVRATFVRGIAVFEDGSFPDPPIGREHRREEKLAPA